MTNPIAPKSGPISGLNTAIQGLTRESARVAKAAADISTAFTTAQNAQAADSVAIDTSRAAVVPAVEDAVRGAVLPPEGDLSAALVNLLQASTAYKANAAAVRVTADVESDVIKMLRR